MRNKGNFAGGEHLIDHRDHRKMDAFVSAVRADLQTAESLLHQRALRNRRGEYVGVEQELQFVDRSCEPLRIADQVEGMLEGPGFQKEFSRFTFEIALDPVSFEVRAIDAVRPTLLCSRLETRTDSGAGPLLAGALAGRRVEGIGSRIAEARLLQDLPGVTAPINAYAAGALPANLSIDVLRAVGPHLVQLPEGSVGLYGGIELQVIDGPLRAGTPYDCAGEILGAGRTPRTETHWYAAEAFEQDSLIARMLMLSRIMRA
jgi:hypothetical protein